MIIDKGSWSKNQSYTFFLHMVSQYYFLQYESLIDYRDAPYPVLDPSGAQDPSTNPQVMMWNSAELNSVQSLKTNSIWVMIRPLLPGWCAGSPTGNGGKQSFSQAENSQANKSVVAYIPSISCGAFCARARYVEYTQCENGGEKL